MYCYSYFHHFHHKISIVLISKIWQSLTRVYSVTFFFPSSALEMSGCFIPVLKANRFKAISAIDYNLSACEAEA